eukprot:Hpha_TRINITY_DN93_c0_g1::TRINITY_DN93_c0_g1_i1::g.110037::m.110037
MALETVRQYTELVEKGQIDDAVQLLSDDVDFQTPKDSGKGKQFVADKLKDRPTIKKVVKELEEMSCGVVVREIQIKIMLMSPTARQTFTVRDGKIVSIVMKKL